MSKTFVCQRWHVQPKLQTGCCTMPRLLHNAQVAAQCPGCCTITLPYLQLQASFLNIPAGVFAACRSAWRCPSCSYSCMTLQHVRYIYNMSTFEALHVCFLLAGAPGSAVQAASRSRTQAATRAPADINTCEDLHVCLLLAESPGSTV
jgi:hypothetical protein